MRVTLDLEPKLDHDLRALARAKGVSVEQYLRDLISQVVQRRSGHAAVSLLCEWEAEDATEEIARRQRDWEDFRDAMNRSHSSDRILYP
jgi:hypothetical protein